jgi:nitroreductase
MSDFDPGLFEIMRTCRAMRRLKPDEVPEELLVRLVEAAQMGPTGSNQQNGRFIVVRDQGRRERIAELNRNAAMGYVEMRRGQVAALPEAEAKSQSRIIDAVEWQAEHLHEAPAMIVPCLAMRAAPRSDSFLTGLGAGGSIWPSVQNILLAARGLGLGAALTTMALSDRDAFKQALDIPALVEPVCLLPIGYPQGKFGPVTRKPVEDVLRWDSWSD